MVNFLFPLSRTGRTAAMAGAVLLMLGLLAAPARSGDLLDLSLEELMDIRVMRVVSASKYEQKTPEAPAAISVVTAGDIRRHGYRTLAELLQGVRGFYITYDRNYNYVGYRGFNRPGDYNSRVLLLIDGVKVNDSVYDQAPVGGDFPLDLDLVERVEIVRGPSYGLYGNNALLVVINVISKSGGKPEGPEIGAEAGSFGTYRGRLSYGTDRGDQGQALLSATWFGSKGQSLYYAEFDTPEQNNGVAENGDRERSGSLFAKLDRKGLTLEGAFIRRSKQYPTAPWGTSFNDPRNKTWDEKGFLDLKLERRLAGGTDLTARVNYSHFNYFGNYAYEDAGTIYLNKDEVYGRSLGFDAFLTRQFSRHMLVAGGDYRDNFRLDQKNYDEGWDAYLDDQRRSRNWGVFLQDEYALADWLKLNANLRYDRFSSFGGVFNPRLGLICRPAAGTSLKYLVGRAFRAPNAYELYYNDGNSSMKANPNLREERIISHDLVWEQLWGSIYSSSLGAYHNTIKNLISQMVDSDDLLVFENLDRVEAYGIEAELAAAYPNGVTGRFSYAYQESKYEDPGRSWTNSPRHLAKLSLATPLWRRDFFLGLEEQYTGRLETLTGGSAGDYFLTNLTLTWQSRDERWDVLAGVFNLFDERYAFPGSSEHAQDSIRQDGINFRVKLTWRN